MNLKKLLPILVLGIIPAHATVIFIDDFNGPSQAATVLPGGTTPTSVQSGVAVGPNVLGGSRSLEVGRSSGTSFDFGTVGSGFLTLGLAPADSGYAQLIWDGGTDGALDQNGIPAVDLTDTGNNTHIALSVRSDLLAPITLTFYSGNGNSSTYTFDTPAQGFGATAFTNYVIAMTSFVPSTGTGADFTGITSALMYIDGTAQPGLDVEIQNFRAMNPTPEPATFGLLGAGLVGLFLRRRKA